MTCPYRFALRTIHRLKPWERAAPLDSLDPMNRGSLIHEVQFQLHGSLRDAGELPVTATNLAAARAALDSTLDAVAARYEQDLAPTSSKGWSDSIEAIRADLAEWLRRCVQETEWVPHRFELGFGVPLSDGLDPASQEEPARLDCGLALRGAIDLVERRADGGLRVTDYKTGRARVPSGAIVDGGRALQPVLYALAAEKLAEGAPVHSGRLYYCTSGGGFRAVEVPLAEPARRAAQRLATVVGSRIENGNLPQAPHEGACLVAAKRRA